jgi:hypothetical protein
MEDAHDNAGGSGPYTIILNGGNSRVIS